MLLPEGEVLKIAKALCSGVPNEPLMRQLLGPIEWQTRRKRRNDAFDEQKLRRMNRRPFERH